jgi:hypothetical protein
VPAVPSCILEPLREEFLALLPPRVDRHPLGCHRRRIDDRIVFDKIVEALVFGCGYERLGDRTCSATTLRRRRDEWIAAGIFDALRRDVLAADERLIGLDLADVAIDGCLITAPCGGECAGRSPVDRATGGLKRSPLADGAGVPIAALPAPAHIRDHALLTVSLDVLTALLEQVGREGRHPRGWVPRGSTSLPGPAISRPAGGQVPAATVAALLERSCGSAGPGSSAVARRPRSSSSWARSASSSGSASCSRLVARARARCGSSSRLLTAVALDVPWSTRP